MKTKKTINKKIKVFDEKMRACSYKTFLESSVGVGSHSNKDFLQNRTQKLISIIEFN